MIKFWRILYSSLRAPFGLRVFCVHKGQRLHLGTDSFEQFAQNNQGDQLRKEFEEFFLKEKIRKDLYIIEYPMTQCISYGCNKLPLTDIFRSDAAIFLTEGFSKLDPHSCSYILKHELAHIKYRDVWLASLFSLLSILLLTGIALYSMHWMTALGLVFLFSPLLGNGINTAWMRFREHRADRFAMKNASLDELRGGIRYFTALKKFNASFSEVQPQFNQEGECKNDYKHPTFGSRIERIQKEILRRGASRYEVEGIDALVQMLFSADQRHVEILRNL